MLWRLLTVAENITGQEFAELNELMRSRLNRADVSMTAAQAGMLFSPFITGKRMKSRQAWVDGDWRELHKFKYAIKQDTLAVFTGKAVCSPDFHPINGYEITFESWGGESIAMQGDCWLLRRLLADPSAF